MQAGDAAGIDGGQRHRCAKGELRENGQLVGRISAVHVERRVGLGVTKSLRLGQSIGVTDVPCSFMLGEDEIAGAVEDALNGGDLVGRQASRQGGDDRDAAGDARLEADRTRRAAGRCRKSRHRAVASRRLVRRDDVLARRQQSRARLAWQSRAADQFDPDFNRRIVQDGLKVFGDDLCWNAGGQSLFRELLGDPAQFQPTAGAGSQTLWLSEQHLGNTGADGAAADKSDANGLSHVRALSILQFDPLICNIRCRCINFPWLKRRQFFLEFG